MKVFAIIAASLIGFLLMVGLWFMGNYNSLVTASAQVDKSWAQVETQYQRRLDLIDNLVGSVKGIMVHEKDIINAVTDARKHYATGPAKPEDQVNGAIQVETALSRLMMVMERYPEIQANDNMKMLMAELGNTENSIAVKRDNYNNVATNYNINVKRFPKNLFANMFGYGERTLFKAEAGAEKAPNVSFE